jgi:hypothetical protein
MLFQLCFSTCTLFLHLKMAAYGNVVSAYGMFMLLMSFPLTGGDR